MKRDHFHPYLKRLLLFGLTATLIAAGHSPLAAAARPQVQVSSADAVRFLEQATFGPTPAHILRVQNSGFKDFLEQEFNARMSLYPALPVFPTDSAEGCPAGAPPNCFRDNYTQWPLQIHFFMNALYGEDQLRQRVAFALSQIFVVSGVEIIQPSSMYQYQNIFLRNAFGNFRQILEEVTLSPTMGRYLDMANNRRQAPNENYAREVLQLFSIGQFKLNSDGTLILDGLGQPIPTYDQNTIINFSKLFTGWTYPPLPGVRNFAINPEYFIGQMVSMETNHDRTSKTLLDGFVVPANQKAETEIRLGLDNIFNHPNVAPFICKQLIQHLVTSNPSPAYLGRVSAVFNNNGSGVRGDLRSVVSAILLDPDARGDVQTDASYGHLREPVLFITNILRAFGATSDGALLAERGRDMGQYLFYSPTVFNYYQPTYVVPSTAILGPEFSIQSTSAAITRANFVNQMVFRTGGPPAGTVINFAEWQNMASNTTALLNELDRLLMHGSMSSAMRTRIATVIDALPNVTAADRLKRAQWAIYLVVTSSQYQVQR
jgi:uncharacterized protein (DUF1800 family)